MIETPGLDWSTARPAPAHLGAAGFRFAMRYVSPLWSTGPNPKDVSAVELAALRAAGLAVGLVFESTGGRARDGRAAGFADGQIASARARTVGYPAGYPIFYAVDFDAQPDQLAVVADYGAGFTAGVSGYPAGGYGSRAVVEHLAAQGGAAGLYWWQTAGWSGDVLSPVAHLYQRVVKRWADIPGTDEDVLCRPLPLYGWAPAPPAPAPHGDDMAMATMIRNTETGDEAICAPGLWYHIPTPAYVALYVAAGILPGPAPAFQANTAQFEHLRDVMLSCTGAGQLAQLLSDVDALAGVDQRIVTAVEAARP